MSALLTRPAIALTVGLLMLAVLLALRRPLLRALRLAGRCMGGLAALSLLHPVGQFIGVTVGINAMNALVLGVLGVPGFALLLMLQWVFRGG